VIEIPTWETERLILRPIEGDDLDAYTELWQDPEFTRHIGGRPSSRHDMWHNLAGNAGCWLMSGVGPLTVIEKASGQLVGRAGLWNEPGWPGVEACWFIGRPWWGRGYAGEAATAAITWAFANRGIGEITTPILPGNTPSIRVAEKLGMRFDHVEFLHGADHNVYVIDRATWARPGSAVGQKT
jgi:RimJ/RimL family protein N-acetyltransferase